jgi:membrane protein
MALDGLIFDLDGTLIDTNGAQVEAWRRAFEACGYRVAPDRIAVEIGKGGDLLVSAVLGAEAEKQDGNRLREEHGRAYLEIARHTHFRVFPGALDLPRRLRERGLKTALATSSKQERLDATFASAGVDLARQFDVVTTRDDAATSKPAPDLVHAALGKLGMFPAQCAMVGDTPYDAAAAMQAGVVGLGVLTGGNDAAALRRAGARAAWRDTADLLAQLDGALETASPGPCRWTRERVEGLMREALAAAADALEQGDFPSGCLLVGADGNAVLRCGEEVSRAGNRTAHAARLALARSPASPRGMTLVSNLEPCVLCTGAAVQAGVDAVVFGLSAPRDEGTRRVIPAGEGRLPFPRVVVGVLAEENRVLLQQYLERRRAAHAVARVERLLDSLGLHGRPGGSFW